MVDRLSAVPTDIRVSILRWLPARALLACEATCSALRATASDDQLWRALCVKHWPQGPNIGALVPTARDCYRSANGWAHLRRCSRHITTIEDSSRSNRRSQGGRKTVVAMDATDEELLLATKDLSGAAEEVSLRRGEVLEWCVRLAPHVSAHDVKLPLAEQEPTLCLSAAAGDRVLMDVLVAGTLRTAWHRRLSDTEACASMDLLRFASVPHQVAIRGQRQLTLVDLQAGTAVGTWSYDAELPDWTARSACVDPTEEGGCCVTMAWRSGQRSVLSLFDARTATGLAGSLDTHHAHVCRVGAGPPGSCYTSHVRSKDIERWDRRAFAAGGGAFAAPAACRPCERAHCSGNAPDFDFRDGILAAVSSGAAGATMGAKLHIFSTAPRELVLGVPLPEIVIDETGHRLSCARGVRLSQRTLSFIADSQRVIRCAQR